MSSNSTRSLFLSVPSFIRIERVSDGGPCPQTYQGASFCSKTGKYQCFAVCCPETSSCASIKIEKGAEGGPWPQA